MQINSLTHLLTYLLTNSRWPALMGIMPVSSSLPCLLFNYIYPGGGAW